MHTSVSARAHVCGVCVNVCVCVCAQKLEEEQRTKPDKSTSHIYFGIGVIRRWILSNT